MNTIDLHMHSQYSIDGEFSVQSLLEQASANKLRVIAIADHNSTRAYQQRTDMNEVALLPAIELDCTFTHHDFHLLGYGIDTTDNIYQKIEEDILLQERNASAKRLSLLQEHLHIYVDEEELKRRSFQDIYVPETICEVAMLDDRNKDNPYMKPFYPGGERSDNPYVNFYWDFCSQGKLAYIPIHYMTMEEAIALYHSQGAIAVLAHPGNNVKEEEELLSQLLQLPLDGIEVYSSYHTPEQIAYYKKVANDNDLLITCGSDFHGKTKPSVYMGKCHMPKEEEELLYAQLIARGLLKKKSTE